MSLLSPSYEDEISLPRTAGRNRKPIYSELGEYGQFVFEPHLELEVEMTCVTSYLAGVRTPEEMFKTLCSDYALLTKNSSDYSISSWQGFTINFNLIFAMAYFV